MTALFAPVPSAARARACLCHAVSALSLAMLPLAGGTLLATAPGIAHATTVSTAQAWVLQGVRPEALSWLWDNLDAALFQRGHRDNVNLRWLQPPATPNDLGYSAGAVYEAHVRWDGVTRRITVRYLPPEQVRARVPSDNFLGRKPYSFLAAAVSVDDGLPFTVLVHYTASGTQFGDSTVRIEALDAPEPAVARAYVAHLSQTLQGLQATLMKELDTFFNTVFLQRGHYQISPTSPQLTRRLTVVQEIKGITPDMLAWWWDHIGNTDRYRMWQPVDHVSFEWAVAPTRPDLQYDVGAVQKVKEYIGTGVWSLSITGADPAVQAPPVPLVPGEGHFYARANPTWLGNLLPSNGLVHSWRANPQGDGVILTSTFENTALAQLLSRTFFDDLGRHALREFQMLPHFLPRLYRREHLGQ
ncbi:hypothetical protein GTZ97_01835 [Aquabacterium fontiphilum]|uniref:DAPG hydrolase family protein n=1 Tax=Aquabacterium fontiphilum TaxID=450365 RepID=UPI0013765821|nr:hypothetical protein [Aquabacterium fontiphilum]NBD19414.1 hypothetical protein [Aquabacterium fontiphilum]